MLRRMRSPTVEPMPKRSRGPRVETGEPLTIGKRILTLRSARGMTQDALASAVDISKSFLSEIENDHTMPGGNIVLRLAEVLGTTTDYILRGGGVPSGSAAPMPMSIPAELAAVAEAEHLSWQATAALVDARRYVLARRGNVDSKPWSEADWRKLYDRLKEYLD